MSQLPIRRVVLFKHGIGYFEREDAIDGDGTLTLTFKQSEVSDVLKSLTVLDLGGGHIASVSYDSTRPLEQILAEVAFNIPDQSSVVALLPQLKGARVALHSGVSDPVEGVILGIDATERQTGDGIVKVVLLSIVTDTGAVRSFDLHGLASVQILDPALRRDVDFYLKTQLSAKKKDARTFTFFAQGKGTRTIRISYTLEAPVWKATYRIILGEPGASATGGAAQSPLIQGWAVVDNTQDEDWEDVRLSLVAGLPVSFVHDLYTPRYIRRPEVRVQETTGVLPPEVEEGMALMEEAAMAPAAAGSPATMKSMSMAFARGGEASDRLLGGGGPSSMPAQVRERKLGDLFEYEIEHPVSIRRNQSALVPIVLKPFDGRPVLLYNRATRAQNPMRCVEFKNSTGLTLEGGPVTVLEAGSYTGEAMLETMKPDEERLVPYAVELGVFVLNNVKSFNDRIHKVIVKNGTLRTHYLKVAQTTYTLNNKSDQEHTVYLEHLRSSGDWSLWETPEPIEITQNHWRFRFKLPARKTTSFRVQQRQTLSQTFALADMSAQQLELWLEQRYVDAATAKPLQQVLDLRQQAARLEASLQQLDKERQTIHAEQKRIRENLQALGDRPAEKELRERFVKTLNFQEDRLEHIEREVRTQTAAQDDLRQRIADGLSKLEYETEL